MSMDKLYTLIDDFYSDPYQVRKQALETSYFPIKESTKHLNVKGPWPGKISKDCYKPTDLDTRVSKALGKIVSSSPPKLGISGFFRISKETDYSATFCHIDGVTELLGNRQYAGVLYLTDTGDANIQGTIFHRHNKFDLTKIETILQYKKVENDFDKKEQWDVIDSVNYKFNRLVIYDASTVHSIGPLFGDYDSTARLTQIFIFNEISHD
jgi:hypothetical protein